MKVSSPHAYRLPGLVPLPKGESEVGELPPSAKKYLEGLIAAGVVKVLDAPKAAPPPLPAPVMEPEPAPAGGSEGAKVASEFDEPRLTLDEVLAQRGLTRGDLKKRSKKKD